MESAKCGRCGQFWTFAGNPELFSVISRLCPVCIPLVLPQMGLPLLRKARR